MSTRPLVPERAPRAEEIVVVARRLLEDQGPEALTMRRVAAGLGIRAPSIYKHLPGKHALELALVEQGMAEMGASLHRAVELASGGAVVDALLRAYRAEALAHPNLYRLATAGPLARHELTPGLEAWAGEPFFLATGDPFVSQALWSFAHGMVVLELDGRFPEPGPGGLDRTWAAGVAAFAAAAGELSAPG